MKQLWIMVAGPYRSGTDTKEEQQSNLNELNKTALEIFDKGHIPIIGVNLALPIIHIAGEEQYEKIMMPLSLAAAQRCDAVIRIGGESNGADQEVELIKSKGGIVFETLKDIPNIL